MKNLFSKISSTLLSLMVIFSSMIIVVDEHYCGETLVDVSFFGVAKHCGMDKMEMISSENIEFKKSNCCKDQQSFVKASVFNKEKNLNNQYDDIDFSSVNYSINLDIFQSFSSEKDYNYKDFLPPEIHQNFQILYQTFLI